MVVDEMHMLGDAQRGPVLELALAKILHSPHAASIQVQSCPYSGHMSPGLCLHCLARLHNSGQSICCPCSGRMFPGLAADALAAVVQGAIQCGQLLQKRPMTPLWCRAGEPCPACAQWDRNTSF